MNPTLCEQVLLSAMALADGEAAPLEELQVKQHLDNCPACRQTVERLDPGKLVPAGLTRTRPEEDLWPAIKQRLESESPAARPRWRRLPAYMAMAAGLLLAVMGTWMLLGDRQAAFDFLPRSMAPNQEATPTSLEVVEPAMPLLAPVDPKVSSEPTLPFQQEIDSDVIAIGVMGRPFFLKGQKLIELKLLDVLKGNPGSRDITSADGIPPFGCIYPDNPVTFTERYKPGTRVVVYLARDSKKGWRTIDMRPIDAQAEKRFRAGIKPYIDIVSAARATDPTARYRELLLPEGKPTMSFAAQRALWESSDPKAAPVIRDMLALGLKGVFPRQEEFGGASVFTYIHLLARMRDAESIDLILKYLDGVDDEKRSQVAGFLPDLCRQADVATIARARGRLKVYLDDYKGDKKQSPYLIMQQAYDQLGKLPR